LENYQVIHKDLIKIIGAKEHNLKSVNVDIPKDKLIVITGPSGSGKSSLAMDTLYQEGRRRYIQSLSSYARQFLGVGKRPKVDKVLGVCPAIAIDQKTVGFNPRSTVGTITEIYDYLRLVFARAGNIICPKCNVPIIQGCPESIAESIIRTFSGKSVWISAQMANDKKGEFVDKLTALFKKGFNKFLIDGELKRFESEFDVILLGLKKTFKHTIFVLIDNLTIEPNEFNRIRESVDKSIQATGI
jgi:excinuclease ABC subunit A